MTELEIKSKRSKFARLSSFELLVGGGTSTFFLTEREILIKHVVNKFYAYLKVDVSLG